MRKPYLPNGRTAGPFFYDNGHSQNHWLKGHCSKGQCTLVPVEVRFARKLCLRGALRRYELLRVLGL
jgi:hypothetical protein